MVCIASTGIFGLLSTHRQLLMLLLLLLLLLSSSSSLHC